MRHTTSAAEWAEFLSWRSLQLRGVKFHMSYTSGENRASFSFAGINFTVAVQNQRSEFCAASCSFQSRRGLLSLTCFLLLSSKPLTGRNHRQGMFPSILQPYTKTWIFSKLFSLPFIHLWELTRVLKLTLNGLPGKCRAMGQGGSEGAGDANLKHEC